MRIRVMDLPSLYGPDPRPIDAPFLLVLDRVPAEHVGQVIDKAPRIAEQSQARACLVFGEQLGDVQIGEDEPSVGVHIPEAEIEAARDAGIDGLLVDTSAPAPTEPEPFKPGDKVRLIAQPTYTVITREFPDGDAKTGDVLVVKDGPDHVGDYSGRRIQNVEGVVYFKRHQAVLVTDA